MKYFKSRTGTYLQLHLSPLCHGSISVHISCESTAGDEHEMLGQQGYIPPEADR